jgi:hypothetical protein
MDSSQPLFSPPSSLSMGEALLLLAYFGIHNLLDLHPELLEFINPITLLEMNPLNMVERSYLLHQSVNIGLLDTGGFSQCSDFQSNDAPYTGVALADLYWLKVTSLIYYYG